MDKLFKNNAYMIMELFIEHPTKEFSLRGVARTLKLSHATVIPYINDLVKLGILNKKNETLYPTYYANIENENYKWYKRNYIIFKIRESGLIEYIYDNTLASSIVLFGSSAKGNYTENSDIDIFVEAKEQELGVKEFEKKLGKTINILFEPNINNLSLELRNNIVNGVILYGFIKIR
jgi:predicted nucleotidyltransferase